MQEWVFANELVGKQRRGGRTFFPRVPDPRSTSRLTSDQPAPRASLDSESDLCSRIQPFSWVGHHMSSRSEQAEASDGRIGMIEVGRGSAGLWALADRQAPWCCRRAVRTGIRRAGEGENADDGVQVVAVADHRPGMLPRHRTRPTSGPPRSKPRPIAPTNRNSRSWTVIASSARSRRSRPRLTGTFSRHARTRRVSRCGAASTAIRSPARSRSSGGEGAGTSAAGDEAVEAYRDVRARDRRRS